MLQQVELPEKLRFLLGPQDTRLMTEYFKEQAERIEFLLVRMKQGEIINHAQFPTDKPEYQPHCLYEALVRWGREPTYMARLHYDGSVLERPVTICMAPMAIFMGTTPRWVIVTF